VYVLRGKNNGENFRSPIRTRQRFFVVFVAVLYEAGQSEKILSQMISLVEICHAETKHNFHGHFTACFVHNVMSHYSKLAWLNTTVVAST
jgi:hypothetical protein